MKVTPYCNTISASEEPDYPGDLEKEEIIRNLVRWNAMAMVVRANKEHAGIGGHISTFASSAVLYEVGQNHFFHAGSDDRKPDLVLFQGHASPGMYARAYLEGRLSARELHHFRQDLAEGGGLTSYPHPYLMPEFWQVPTVSMGLGPLMSVYQARLNRYLEARELLKPEASPHVWCFPGDGEMDEPESLGGLSLAAREKLDNLTWVVNCNLQRLDGPVRGNSKVIQELEGIFSGAGWNVIKVIWGSNWDPIFEKDKEGRLLEKLDNMVDGEFQRIAAMDGREVRKTLFSESDYMRELVVDLKDDELEQLLTGGHDPVKVHAAYKAALETRGKPTVILVKSVKGYGLGDSGEAHNVTHQQKKLDEKGLRDFRDRFSLEIPDSDIPGTPFFRPNKNDSLMTYLHERREKLGGYLPKRTAGEERIRLEDGKAFETFLEGSEGEEATTTSACIRLLGSLLKDNKIGERIVPIIPDEARTFGADALFRQVGIYAANGQQYEPIDKDNLLYYRESKSGQILEEGITEAGSMGSFIAAGTAADRLGITLVPFYFFYSMFGFQRIGDLAWAAGDSLARGFMLGGTAGRTTLNGEGLQHQDGHSHVLASTFPHVLSYDPAFAYEVAVIIRDGLVRMFEDGERLVYYLTLYNEAYPMPTIPEEVEKGITEGLYCYQKADTADGKNVNLFASGSIMKEALTARELLEEFDVAASVWSATSYKKLRSGGLKTQRWNRMHPGEERKQSYLERIIEEIDGPIVAVTDYMKLVPDQIRGWIKQPFTSLGTDGFGRSDTHGRLREFFEIDASHIAYAALELLDRDGKLDDGTLERASRKLGIDPEKRFPEFA